MIETSSDFLRSSSGKSSGKLFGNVRLSFRPILENLRDLQKVVGNLWKIATNFVCIENILHNKKSQARVYFISPREFLSFRIWLYDILGNPRATSRDDAIFSGESLLQVLRSPWELILTEPVPEVVEFRSADWAEKYFSAQSASSSSRVTLSLSYTK